MAAQLTMAGSLGTFHRRHGRNICLLEKGTVAHRVKSWDNGIVFTEQPIAVGNLFQVKLIEENTDSLQILVGFLGGSIRIGVTTQCPDNIVKIPSDAHKFYSSPDYWIMSYDIVHNSGCEIQVNFNLRWDLGEGHSVGCMVTPSGELHYYLDGEFQCVGWSGLPTDRPYWGVFDVCGEFKKIKSEFIFRDSVEQIVQTSPSFNGERIKDKRQEFQEQQREHPQDSRDIVSVPQRDEGQQREHYKDIHKKEHTENRTSTNDKRQMLQEPSTAHQQLKQNHQQLKQNHQQLQQDHQQLQQDHQQLKQNHQQLQQDHQQLKQNHQQLQQDHQQLQQDRHQLQEECYQLQKSHHRQREEHSQQQKKLQGLYQLQDTYQQQLEKYLMEKDQLQETLEQVQKELVTKQQKITAMEESWRVSHKEITFTKEKLGKGAWGAIRVGIFREQRVAIKQMHELIISETTLELLHREINTMAQLRHPNLLQFIGAVLDDPSGNPMIITEIMDISLRDAYENKQLTPDPSCEPVMLTIMRDVAVGLNYLHCLPDPIIHRDVSSANVLLESKGPHKWKTKISDFGSANKACKAITHGIGTLVYSAPESIPSLHRIQKVLTTKMDVYSYGVLLCEVMTCRFPDPPIFQEMLQLVRSRSPRLHDVILSCTDEDPSNRSIMKQVIKDLDIYIKQLLK